MVFFLGVNVAVVLNNVFIPEKIFVFIKVFLNLFIIICSIFEDI